MNKKLINTIAGSLEVTGLLAVFTLFEKLHNTLAACCFLFLISLYLSIKSVTMLYNSACFYRDTKKIPQKKIKTVSAVVISSRTAVHSGTSTGKAKAVYTLNNKEIKGRMICAYYQKLDPDDKIRIIPDKRNGTLFAFSVQHIKDAVLTYSVFSLLSVLFTAIMLAGVIYGLIHI